MFGETYLTTDSRLILFLPEPQRLEMGCIGSATCLLRAPQLSSRKAAASRIASVPRELSHALNNWTRDFVLMSQGANKSRLHWLSSHPDK